MKRAAAWGVAAMVLGTLWSCSGSENAGGGASKGGDGSGGAAGSGQGGVGGSNASGGNALGGVGTSAGAAAGRAGSNGDSGRGGAPAVGGTPGGGNAGEGATTAGPSGEAGVNGESSAPRCDATQTCAGSLSCVGGFCIDCTSTTCPAAGEPVVVVDYNEPVAPGPVIALSTALQQADIAFVIDTTSDMSSAWSNFAAGFQTVVGALSASIPSVAFGLLSFKDFGDTSVVHADHRVQTVLTPAGVQSLQTVLNNLSIAGGGDAPEAGWEALYALIGGPAITVSNYTSAIELSATLPIAATTGETQGLLPGLGFRENALPVVVTLSSAEWHDAPGSVASGEDGLNDYAQALAGVPSRATVLSQLRARGVRVIGIAATGTGTIGSPKMRAQALASDTRATSDPAAFGAVGIRPAACSLAQCCTGVNGAGESSDANGQCSLGFSYSYPSPAGIPAAVVNGVSALIAGGRFDISVVASDTGSGAVSTFLDHIALVVDGTDGLGCLSAPVGALTDHFSGPRGFTGTDGVLDTVTGAKLGAGLCVRLIAKPNTAVPRKKAAQFLQVQLQTQDVVSAGVPLGVPSSVAFMVPPI